MKSAETFCQEKFNDQDQKDCIEIQNVPYSKKYECRVQNDEPVYMHRCTDQFDSKGITGYDYHTKKYETSGSCTQFELDGKKNDVCGRYQLHMFVSH